MKSVISAAIACALIAVAPLATPTAAAAQAPRPYGHFTATFQYRDGSVLASGVAFNRADPSASIRICVAVGTRCLRTVRADNRSARFDRNHAVAGRHGFSVRLPRQRPGVRLNLRSYVGKPQHLSRTRVQTAGARVVRVAKRYVGKSRYSYGGASPRSGFDCSGYVLYSYRRAHVAHLRHSTEAQRHAAHMHRIARSNALPGDLIFYMSGGSSYHVAIYAGHGMQYAAADERDGIRYQHIWSKQIEFETDWH